MRTPKWHVWIECFLMLVISAAIYLPLISQFGYYNDDWYSMYAARVSGTEVFHQMYGIDRPGRAYVMIPLYELFQGNPLYYNISAYVFRLAGAVTLLWVLRLLWGERKLETFLIACLFLIYPGFLSMPNAIDFQSHLIGIWLAFISLGLGILSVWQSKLTPRVLLWFGTVLTGWAYLSQMEYYLGFEATRLILFAVLAGRSDANWRKKISATFITWLPYSIIPVFYLIWRIFFFQNERVTTDAGLQLGALLDAPLVTLYAWIINLTQSVLNVTLFAWGVPLTQLAFPLDTSSNIRGIFLGMIVAGIVLVALRYLEKGNTPVAETSARWRHEMLLAGLAWTVAGLIMVILANRAVVFPVYSRYGLVSAAGAIMVVVAGIQFLSERRLQIMLVGLLFFSSAFTHYANGLYYAGWTRSLRAFWWQVAWRIPQLEQNATIIASYPNSGIREDSFVWGPANHIYYPYQVKSGKVQAGVHAILLDHEAVIRIINRDRQVYRKHVVVDTYRNYRNFVIFTQPSPFSCLQVIDGLQPEYSRYETDAIMVIGTYSEVEHIKLDETFKTPPEFLFGPEPPHGWCFYYAKAAYERQRGNWSAVLEIGDQAFSQGLAPQDLIEWMPFLQAYAYAEDSERLIELAPAITADPFVARQVCNTFSNDPSLASDMKAMLIEHYCIPN